MTTILAFFLLAALVSVVVTPHVRSFGHLIGALDYPDQRKIHDQVVPRCGGLAIYLGFFLPFLALVFYQTKVTHLLQWDKMTFGFFAGSTLILLMGLWDDIRGLRAWAKLLLQISVAALAWWSGFRIDGIILPVLGSANFSLLSLPLTVFWFVAVINAINLMDGLDGLAAGIALFASIILAVISVLRNNYLGALLFASFAGGLLGFLRYNFNPASIFLGDSGSYFIGFVFAALGIGTSQKSSVTVAILIPFVALGLPLIDMVLSTVRRFVYGAKIFAPDREHLHHRLLKLGYTSRRAALFFYGITIILGLSALVIENLRDDRVGLVLGALAVMSVLGIRKLGYLEYFTTDKVLGWFADMTDESGISRNRRTFLSRQVAISTSDNIFQFWGRIIYAAEKIHLDAVSLELNPKSFNGCSLPSFNWENGSPENTTGKKLDRCLQVELPLISNGDDYGTLRLKKSICPVNGDRLVLKRVEHLRRAVTDALENLSEKSLTCPEVVQDRRSGCRRTEEPVIDPVAETSWNGHEKRKPGGTRKVVGRKFWQEEEEKRNGK